MFKSFLNCLKPRYKAVVLKPTNNVVLLNGTVVFDRQFQDAQVWEEGYMKIVFDGLGNTVRVVDPDLHFHFTVSIIGDHNTLMMDSPRVEENPHRRLYIDGDWNHVLVVN